MALELIPDDDSVISALLQGIKDTALVVTDDAVKQIADHLEDKIRQNISLTGHSLEDLAKMGHPYATRNVGSNGDLVSSIVGNKPYQVHIQRNVIRGKGGGPSTLVDSLGIDFSRSALEVRAVVGIDEVKAGHVEYVVLGTRFMVARDFFAGTFLEVVDDLFDIFQKVTGFNRLRTDSSLF